MNDSIPDKPRIVVLDGYTLAPAAAPAPMAGRNEHAGQALDWRAIQGLGDLMVYDRTPADLVVDRATNADAVLVNKVMMTRAVLGRLPKLGYIGVLATGVNNVDLDAAAEHGVVVTNVPAYGSESVAQHVFAMLLELTNRTREHSQAARDGRWSNGPDFSYSVWPMMELADKTLGIVGVGSIGRRVARIGAALGMRVAAADQSSMKRVHIEGVPIQWMPLDTLLPQADVLTLHCPLTPRTHGLINADRLAQMKPTALLINTSRGPIVDEQALAKALNQGRLAGAGLDVLCREPPPEDHPLLAAPRCVVTPHVAWASVEARQRLMHQAAANLHAFQQGTPINVVHAHATDTAPPR